MNGRMAKAIRGMVYGDRSLRKRAHRGLKVKRVIYTNLWDKVKQKMGLEVDKEMIISDDHRRAYQGKKRKYRPFKRATAHYKRRLGS